MKFVNIKKFWQGALCIMIFGMYHQYITTNMIKQNDLIYKQMIEELKIKIDKLEKKRYLF